MTACGKAITDCVRKNIKVCSDMKRFLAAFLALLTSLTLIACGSGPAKATDPTTFPTAATDPTTETEDPYRYRTHLQTLLDQRNLPALKSRGEMLDILQREVYGYIPAKPENLKFTVHKNVVSNYCGGKAEIRRIIVECTVNGRPFSFPFRMAIPKNAEKVPFFVHIAFSLDENARYQPTEELVKSGFAVLFFDYEDVTTDDGDFTNGLAGVLYPDGKRENTDAGKIAMWAWAAHRVLDYAETISDQLDMSRSIVCGHSRLGKTALLAGATDERFAFTYSNNSGSTGAALARRKKRETVERICSVFPFWFCTNYQQYRNREPWMPFDQHYLLACIAPRKLLVGSAFNDTTADPISEQLACYAASPAFRNGFKCEYWALTGEEYFEGDIGYHLRAGDHSFSKEDWRKLMKFVNYHTAD